MYLDNYGLIVQRDGDPGDALARTGNYCALEENSKQLLLHSIGELEVYPGVYCRHPTLRYDPKFAVSRDQELALVPALGKHGLIEECRRLFDQHKGRKFLYPNGDLSTYATFSAYIRALKASKFKWLLWILDIGFFIDAMIRIGWLPRWKHETKSFVGIDADDVGDDVLFCELLIQAGEVYDTPIAKAARQFYAKRRPKNYGNTLLGEQSAVMGAISWYFREDSGANTEIGEAFRAPIARYIDKEAYEKNH